MRPAHWTAYLCLGASMALVGSYVGLSKALVLVFPVFLLALLRFGIALIAMLGWLHPAPGESPLGPREHGLLFLQSFFGNFLFSICMLFGVSLSSALAAGVIMAALPAVVAIFSRVFLRESISARVMLAIACAVGGIALVSFSRHHADARADGASTSTLGNALLFGAVCCEATYVVIGKRLSAHLGPKRISALINLWGFALVLPFGAWQAATFDFGTVSAASWLFLLGYSLAASVVTVWLWMTGLKHVDAASAGTFTVLLPLSAATVGVAFLGERFNAAHAVAFILALAGILLATWRPAAAERISQA